MARERPAQGSDDRFAFTADRGDAGVRVDLVLLRYLRGRLVLSRRRLQAAIEQGRVTVNGVRATKASSRVAAGDCIEALLPTHRRRGPALPQPLPLDVLFEDDYLLALDKAPGIVVHPSYKHADGTVFNAVLWHLREQRVQPRLLNRLDKDTSGVLLLSKSHAAHEAVVQAMRAAAVRKEYLAVVTGVPDPPAGTIAARLRRDPRDTRRVATSEGEGKESETVYATLRCAPPFSLVRCELVTGRMHQLRVHLAARGWPIVGDRMYGAGLPALPAPAPLPAPPAPTFPRQALHAWRLTLPHPATGERLVIIAPIPEDMRKLMEATGLHPIAKDDSIGGESSAQ